MTASSIISEYLRERIAAGDFPSAVYLVAQRGEVVLRDALGFAVVEPERIAASTDTIYDLASLTKPLVTGLLTVMLIERGDIDPTQTIGDILPDFHVSNCCEITVNQLLFHTSGLPAWLPFYLLVDRPDEVPAEIARILPVGDQQPVTYSDLNFIVLATLIEYLADDDLENVYHQVIRLIGLEDTRFNPLKQYPKSRIAASEKGNEFERQTCIEQGYLSEMSGDKEDVVGHLRNRMIWGEVHDGNAWFMGGAAGHAGLFSTADDIFKLAQQFLPKYTSLLRPESCELFSTNFTPRLNEDRSVSFQLASTIGSTAGTKLSPQSFGHNGFTGTSLWIDPKEERVFVLLTNRTHAHPLPFTNINSVRRRFHDLAVEELDKNS